MQPRGLRFSSSSSFLLRVSDDRQYGPAKGVPVHRCARGDIGKGPRMSFRRRISGFALGLAVVANPLSNGMHLLLVHREGEATVAGGWVAHVGSSNERPGITGISHLFEHMMFKGTPTIGTKDYRKDVAIIAEQEQVRDEMRQEEVKMRAAYRRGEIDDLLKPENKTPRYRELEKKFDELIKKQREVLVKNEFDRIYTTGGGSGMNAFTNEDMTGYFITVPSNKLELWMWMESDRLFH